MPERVTPGYLDSDNTFHQYGSPGAMTPKNAEVAVTNSSTELIGAASTASRQTLIENTGDRTLYIAFGETATTAKYPLPVGRVLKSESLQAINAITASGTGAAFVLAEASS